jgi:GNAT superfamily N-acetyltransferase
VAEVETLAPEQLEEARPMLLDLLLEEQGHYPHRQMSRQEIDRDLVGRLLPGFTGENVILASRDETGRLAALCWLVFFDPGTGLEGEVAEVYVRPDQRGRGLARRLLARAVETFGERGVTLGTVWTHPGNDRAVRLYREAGFEPTEQMVLTWLPAGAREPG